MPNPFPGMAPYLEGPFWSSVQFSFAVGIARTLAPKLRPRYFALPMERRVRVAPDPIEVPGMEPQVEQINLLRICRGFPTTEVIPPTTYSVCLSRANRRPRIEVWQVALESRLPVVPVPLSDGEPDEALDLQSVLNANYEGLSYDLATPHIGQPPIPLSDEQQVWADDCLRKAGLKT